MTRIARHPLAALAAVSLAFAVGANVASAAAHEPHHTLVPATDVKWGPAPPSLPPGAQAALLYGDPGKDGPFVLRLKFPAGYVVPPHRHTKDEPVTVLAGKLGIGSGERIEPAKIAPLVPGGFVYLPGGMPHYARAEGVETIVQINGMGPFDVVYVNPADDPRKQQ